MILSAGVIVVRRSGDRWLFLLLRAYRNWDFPKGIVEEGEDPLVSARREVLEETGITDLRFRWGAVFKETVPYRSSGQKIARYYIAETRQASVVFSINPEIGKPEHHEYRWVSPDGIQALVPGRILPVIEWAQDLLRQEGTSDRK
ncbi:MAG: NUDIX domain-containing protein [Desulfobacteraceae bacterium]|nr:MAG: NUDIX domain-containing protein [Desulfobacteraceae bacterium]